LIGSELSSPNFNSSPFAIRYPNIVTKLLCGNLDICLTSTLGPGILFACFQSQIVTEGERSFFGSRFSVVLLSSSAEFATEMDFGREKAEHANAPNRYTIKSSMQDAVVVIVYTVCCLPVWVYVWVSVCIGLG